MVPFLITDFFYFLSLMGGAHRPPVSIIGMNSRKLTGMGILQKVGQFIF
jgi:hypothetical protein